MAPNAYIQDTVEMRRSCFDRDSDEQNALEMNSLYIHSGTNIYYVYIYIEAWPRLTSGINRLILDKSEPTSVLCQAFLWASRRLFSPHWLHRIARIDMQE
ncbi:uncharacterized protein MCYG_02982 [Microsporum canis CBS 113480]|uniref:Uncharacterized protein n=1 Tax=Arthroderma otae (strain ATCC MYA-4605 / CBS 113480) TaxID=554155 RepID=C5FKE1_ARTOC|nr:uncharacterized protein MCYG_02982 [Microsporum canis CBS 113480]EEQ30163.1 predicted protein [Microsporum canis CBS 113480]